jgi:hypothetical protein
MRISGICGTILTATLLLGVSGCAVERTPHLYPINPIASTTGVLEGKLVGHGQGHGKMEITMPDGEFLSGEYSIVFDSSVGFGSIFATVYGSGGARSGSGISSNFSMSGSGQGSASLFGNRGTSVQCEFLNNNMTGHGYGACRSSKGGVYRMLY